MEVITNFMFMYHKALIRHPKDFCNFDTSKNVQEQLQEMLTGVIPQGELIFQLAFWLLEPKQEGMTDKPMEQIWLSFVMDKKYSERWVNQEWERRE